MTSWKHIRMFSMFGWLVKVDSSCQVEMGQWWSHKKTSSLIDTVVVEQRCLKPPTKLKKEKQKVYPTCYE